MRELTQPRVRTAMPDDREEMSLWSRLTENRPGHYSCRRDVKHCKRNPTKLHKVMS